MWENLLPKKRYITLFFFPLCIYHSTSIRLKNKVTKFHYRGWFILVDLLECDPQKMILIIKITKISDGKTISFPLRLFTVIKIFKPLHEVRIVDHSLIKTKFSTVSLISRKELICGYYVLIYYDAKTEVS